MGRRERFTEELKLSMKAGTAARTGALRLIVARLKDLDIAGRARGPAQIAEDEVQSMLRGMVKSRRESIALYIQGKRPELAAKEEAEIAVIESFLPAQLDEAAMQAAVAEAVAETGAKGIKDMGRVMAALKARHAASLDLGRAGALVRAALAPAA